MAEDKKPRRIKSQKRDLNSKLNREKRRSEKVRNPERVKRLKEASSKLKYRNPFWNSVREYKKAGLSNEEIAKGFNIDLKFIDKLFYNQDRIRARKERIKSKDNKEKYANLYQKTRYNEFYRDAHKKRLQNEALNAGPKPEDWNNYKNTPRNGLTEKLNEQRLSVGPAQEKDQNYIKERNNIPSRDTIRNNPGYTEEDVKRAPKYVQDNKSLDRMMPEYLKESATQAPDYKYKAPSKSIFDYFKTVDSQAIDNFTASMHGINTYDHIGKRRINIDRISKFDGNNWSARRRGRIEDLDAKRQSSGNNTITKSGLTPRELEEFRGLTNTATPLTGKEGIIERSFIKAKNATRAIAAQIAEKRSRKEIETWKNIQRADTKRARPVSVRGENIDPFTDKINNATVIREKTDANTGVKSEEKVKVLRTEGYSDPGNSSELGTRSRDNPNARNENNLKFTNTRSEADISLNRQNAEGVVESRAEFEKAQMKRMESQLNRRENPLRQHFEPEITKQNRANLQSNYDELAERQKRRSLNYPEHLIASDAVETLSEDGSMKAYGGQRSSKLQKPKHIETFEPRYGSQGLGMGWRKAVNASGAEHARRALHFANPLGTSGREVLMNSFGLLNHQQSNMLKNAAMSQRFGLAMIPASVFGYSLYQMSEGASGTQILSDNASFGGAMMGWRTGASVGATLTRTGSTVMRTLGMAAGGTAGALSGLALGMGVVEGVSDVLSNESVIRKFAKKQSTKEIYTHSRDTRQSLTARQSALNKLSRSGLNNRNLLLGNEANVLAGLM